MQIPLIEGLERLDLSSLASALEAGAAKDAVSCVDWPREWPEKPDCLLYVARTGESLVILYRVSGRGLRAENLQDNGNVWEDSCCEFFVADPSDGTYYNFELNCIGTLLAAKGAGRESRQKLSLGQLAQVKRWSSLPHELIPATDGDFSWTLAMAIPFSLMGMEELPAQAKANFYKCGDLTPHPHFLSWNPVLTETPDFHRPEYFGILHFA